MIIKSASGNRLVVVQRGKARVPQFDKYSTHHGPGAGGFGVTAEQAISGLYICYYEAILNSLDDFYYPFLTTNDVTQVRWVTEAWAWWVGPNGRIGAFGEWFNASGRGQIFDKVAVADWPGYLASH
jgi:hypothetical protein